MVPNEDLDSISSDLLNLVFLLTARIFNPNQMAKGMCVPHSHMKAILHIAKFGPCPVSKIASELMISKPNMTPIIDNLISEGYVHRFNDPNDRRIVMIEATEKAHVFLENSKQMLKSKLAEKIAVLSDKDLEELRALVLPMTDLILKI